MRNVLCAIGLMLLGCAVSAVSAQEEAKEPEFKGKIGRTYGESKEWWPDPVVPPKGL